MLRTNQKAFWKCQKRPWEELAFDHRWVSGYSAFPPPSNRNTKSNPFPQIKQRQLFQNRKQKQKPDVSKTQSNLAVLNSNPIITKIPSHRMIETHISWHLSLVNPINLDRMRGEDVKTQKRKTKQTNPTPPTITKRSIQEIIN